MPDLDFGDTDEEAILVLKGFANRVNSELYDNGRVGALTVLRTFIATHDAREIELERQQKNRHRENSIKINVILAICAVGMLILTAVSIFVAFEVHESKLTPAKVFHSQTLELFLASQDAKIPPMRM